MYVAKITITLLLAGSPSSALAEEHLDPSPLLIAPDHEVASEALISRDQIDSLEKMHEQGLTQGAPKREPWRGYFYPMVYGGHAARFLDPNFPRSENIKANYAFVRAHPLDKTNATQVSQLSPAEKYDLLVGDKNETLTKFSWEQGLRRVEDFKDKKLPAWYGYCDGLTAASALFEKPNQAFTVLASDNETLIKFYPDDIKGLLGMQMALSSEKRIIVGSRCIERRTKQDENGRVVSDECRDVNPATFHIALTNRVGLHKEHLYFDRNFDYEEWNFPVVDYKYSYKNLSNTNVGNDLNSAMVELSEIHDDKFRAHRNPKTKYLVGIVLTVTVPNVFMPQSKEWDSLSDEDEENKNLSYTYLYDLELDENKKIVGGEWHTQSMHPDFLWIYEDGTGMSEFDKQVATLPQWDGQGPPPADWLAVIQKSSTQGRPLQTILNQLLRLSL